MSALPEPQACQDVVGDDGHNLQQEILHATLRTQKFKEACNHLRLCVQLETSTRIFTTNTATKVLLEAGASEPDTHILQCTLNTQMSTWEQESSGPAMGQVACISTMS
eukprot:3198156-Amphidinium_carterae.2